MELYPVEIIDLRYVKEKGIKVKAIKTGEYRKPKRGEWYISGALATAYKAPNSLGSSYHIAKLVKVKEEIKEIIVGDYNESDYLYKIKRKGMNNE